MKRIVFFSIFILCVQWLYGQDNYPVPTEKKDLLFYIQHNRGKNTFVYSLRRNKNKAIDLQEPVQVYRQLFDNDGEIRGLTAMQKNFAYGINQKKMPNGAYELSIVSIPSQKLYLHLPRVGLPYVSSTINGKQMRVDRIFIQIKDGTSGLGTKLDYIQFYGTIKNQAVQQKLVL